MSGLCPYCDRTMNTDAGSPPGLRATKEHIIPRTLGDFGRYNVTYACADCNHLKNSRTPPELLALADMADQQAKRWRKLAQRVDALTDERGLIAPWRGE